MALQNQIGAFEDCFDYFDRALATRKGLRLCFGTFHEAQRFQMRMHHARALQRKESERMYEKDTPQWGKSEYDKLVVKNPVEDTDGNWWVYIEPHSSKVIAEESLDDE